MRRGLKVLIGLLVGGYLALMLAVAIIPAVSDMSAGSVTGVPLAVFNLGKWAIPIAATLVILFFGVKKLTGKR